MRRYTLLMVVMMVSLLGTATTRPADPKDKEPEKKRSNVAVNGKKMIEWMDDLKSKDLSIFTRGIATLKAYGAEAREASPSIIKALNHKDASVRVNAVITLGFVGFNDPKDRDEGTNALIRLLSDREGIVRFQAARALARLREEGQLTVEGTRGAVAALMSPLRDQSNCEIRAAAANALGRVGYQAPGPDLRAFKALLFCLNDRYENSSDVRMQALLSLIVLGPPTDRILKSDEKTELHRLLKRLINDDKQPEKLAIWTRVAIMYVDGEISEQHLSAIASHLKDKKVEPRIDAARALATLAHPSLNLDIKSRLSDLIKALDDKDPNVIYWSTVALGEMGQDAEGALDALQKLTSHQDNVVQQGAKDAIEKIKTIKKKEDLKKKDDFAPERKKKHP